MRMAISIKMDNAAFHDDVAGGEAARILRELAKNIESTDFSDAYDRHHRLMDVNGNGVGEMRVTGR